MEGKTMSKTHDEFVREISIINPDIKIVGKYTRAVDRIEVKCNRCGKIWSPVAYSLSAGKSCPHCSAIRGSQKNKGRTGKKTNELFIRELNIKHPNVRPLDSYKNNKTSIRFKCDRCGNEWSAKPYSILQGHGCPRCAKSGTSFMEQFILASFQTVLGKENVLSRNRSLIGMELDIYIPELHFAIEPGNWRLHEKSIGHDRKKRALCKQNGVELVTIYDNYPLNLAPPFEKDCYVFPNDYNKADHVNIKNLVNLLFERAGIDCTLSEYDWNQIEKQAYANALSKTHESFAEELKGILPNVEICGEYQNSNKRLRVRCSVCGYEWDAVPACLLHGDGCRKCGTKAAHQAFMKSQAEFVREVGIVNPTVEITGDYCGRHSPVKARCRVCGFEWTLRASSLLRGSSHKGARTLHKSLE